MARRCVRRIEALLGDGQDADAAETARRCINRINRRSDQCVRKIEHRCGQCVRHLERFGAMSLAKRVRFNCDKQVGLIRDSQTAAVDAINQALNGGMTTAPTADATATP